MVSKLTLLMPKMNGEKRRGRGMKKKVGRRKKMGKTEGCRTKAPLSAKPVITVIKMSPA